MSRCSVMWGIFLVVILACWVSGIVYSSWFFLVWIELLVVWELLSVWFGFEGRD